MTLGTLTLMIGAIALVLTLIAWQVLKIQKNGLVTFLQNFTGALFIFSGWVKAIDPLGTAYKMEQYFGEFQHTFSETMVSFIAPLFPWLSGYSVGFSVVMIVFELVLGIMLVLGIWPKFSSWAFFIMVGFFTLLTGFTYLTGYVPSGVNFFEFGKWGPYVETNMKVTDCGCFGDFLKLKPKVSFFKDVFLMIPAFIFIFKHKEMHQVFTKRTPAMIVAGSSLAVFLYCLSNYAWDLPHTDFRPFARGVDLRGKYEAEKKAAADVKVLGYKITNKTTSEVVEMDYDTFLKEYKNYPKEEWSYDQITSKPEIEPTKISDFDVEALDGTNMTDEILNDTSYHFMIVSYKLYHEAKSSSLTVNDTVWVSDSIVTPDSVLYIRNPSAVTPRTITETEYIWDKKLQDAYREKINPLAEAAEKDGFKVYAIVGGAGEDMIESFRHDTQTAFPFYVADDILLKTIIRSNPGVVLLKDGNIIHNWHYKKLPSYEEIKAKFMKS